MRAAFLIVLTIVLDYFWLIWFRDESYFIHLTGAKGYQMFWHVHELSMMVNFIIIGIALLQDNTTHIAKVFIRAYVLWQICLTGMYLISGPSLTEVERAMKPILFFIFVIVGLWRK